MSEEKKKNGIFHTILKAPAFLKGLLAGALVMVVCFGAYALFGGKENESSHTEKVTEVSFREIGELATMEALITIVEAMDDQMNLFKTDIKIPFTKSICIFSHDFEIKAGYDFASISSTVEHNEDGTGTVTVYLPEAEILSNGLVPDGEVVYYENESIFTNLSEEKKGELRAKMGVKAEETAIENGILTKARDNAENILTAFILGMDDYAGYDVVFEDAE